MFFTLLHALATISDLFFRWYLQASRKSPEGTGGLAMDILPSNTDKLNQQNKAEEPHFAQLHCLHFWSLFNFRSHFKQILATFLTANLKQV